MSKTLPSCFALLLGPILAGVTGCDTMYSRSYSYEKTQFLIGKHSDGSARIQRGYSFEPVEQQAIVRADLEKQKRESERMRVAAQRTEKLDADKIATDSPSLKMDSGLGVSPSLGASSSSGGIPGLDSPASMSSAPSMSGGGSIPGLSGAPSSMAESPSMSGASMAPSMSGAPSMAPSMSGADSMVPGMVPGMAPAPAGGAAPAAPGAPGAPKPTTTLPGL